MGFKKLLARLGAGGASVETVLNQIDVAPGGLVQGEIRIQGGTVDQEIEGLSVGLQAKAEVGDGDQAYKQDIEFAEQRLGGAFTLRSGAVHTVRFGLEIPWETPVTVIGGQALRGVSVEVSTELAIAGAVDSSDLAPVDVHPLPVQQAIFDAMIQLGFRFHGSDLEKGRIRGTRQTLPFYQEIEFRPPSQYQGLSQVELCFVADQRAMDVVLEMDRKPGLFSEGSDTYRSFQVGLHDYRNTNWAECLHQWLSEVGSKRSRL